ncbi:diguanylate cyclase (GGDEF) domain-containing protein [Pseudonocardia thermophila]|uniref:Diguanylate cyclase (GGDEF) domain-containing protein n=1 Tax=Pseudonocardia thermophila TaxID=1848 RepID=A0A1M6YLV5_PSETH|nr:GGDEF domain-containing protein [Pseudonocardia thermophila]SHL19065.1 diguanylate cyclase (GGDEF) domain-containing protein [Pseudonocardia thermophila]
MTGSVVLRRQRRRPIGIAGWALWSLPRRVLWVVLPVELVTVVTVFATAERCISAMPENWLTRMAVLVLAGVISTEVSRGVERVRHRRETAPHIDLSSVWTFAAAALLPGIAAAAVVAILYAHIYLRVDRPAGVRAHQVIYTVSTIVLAVQTASAIMGVAGPNPYTSGLGLVLVALAVLAYAAVNMVLVTLVVLLIGEQHDLATFLRLLRGDNECVLEFASLSMGALVGGAMVSLGLGYAVLVLPPLVMLHRTVLVRQLEEKANLDAKTGLLNAAAWHERAGHELRRAERANQQVAVLVLDLDHFKQINDRHGHLVGDTVLAAVADAVRAEVRDEDVVGRFGGEEFVVLLRDVDVADDRRHAEAVAERIRRRVAELAVDIKGPDGTTECIANFTVSIGGAVRPPDGPDLVQLLETADAAMYEAKNTGRNCVRIGAPGG